LKYSFHIIVVILCLSCEETTFDDLLADFSAGNTPTTTLDPLDSPYDSSSVNISWAGNEDANSFSYRLEPISYTDTVKTYSNWSVWAAVYTVTFINLDDGSYNFYIKSRSTIENEETPDSVNFIVDAIEGPAIRMYPLYQQVSVDEAFSMYIYIEDMVDLGGLELHMSHPPSKMTANSITAETILANASIFFDTINPTEGTIELISTGADFSGFTGSGMIAKISLTAGNSTGQNTMQIHDTSILKNSGNVQIDILDRVHGLIEVVE